MIKYTDISSLQINLKYEIWQWKQSSAKNHTNTTSYLLAYHLLGFIWAGHT